jgi:DNA-binding response OmpR family regulator
MKPNLLLVDDDPDFVASLAEVLRLAGYSVDTAWSGEKAVELFSSKSYGLALVDLQLPGMSGLATISALRGIRPDALFFLVTGHGIDHLLDTVITGGRWRRMPQHIGENSLLAALDSIKPAGAILTGNDPSYAARLQAMLEKRGLSVATLHSFGEASESNAVAECDVLILALPTFLANLEIYEKLARRQSKPVILCSGCPAAKFDSRDIVHQLRVAGILTKPFTPAKLLDALEQLVKTA